MELASPTPRGYLLLADISGYTAFLTRSELDHARPMGARSLGTDRLEPHGAGARLRCHVGRSRGKGALHHHHLVRPFYALMRKELEAGYRKGLDRLRQLGEEEGAASSSSDVAALTSSPAPSSALA